MVYACACHVHVLSWCSDRRKAQTRQGVTPLTWLGCAPRTRLTVSQPEAEKTVAKILGYETLKELNKNYMPEYEIA